MTINQGFLELPFTFDIQKLNEDLNCVENDDWVKHPNTNAYNGLWVVSSLSSIDGETKQIIAIENMEYLDTQLMRKTTYIKSVLNSLKTKIEAVRFMKLGAHSIIKEHCDKGSCFDDGFARLHIPITTNDDVEFMLNSEKTKMDIGKCYYIDADAPHSVVNNGNSDRVHLLIDCHVNEWMREIFKNSGFIKTQHKYGEKSITDENVNMIIESFLSMNTPISLKMAEELKKQRDSDG